MGPKEAVGVVRDIAFGETPMLVRLTEPEVKKQQDEQQPQQEAGEGRPARPKQFKAVGKILQTEARLGFIVDVPTRLILEAGLWGMGRVLLSGFLAVSGVARGGFPQRLL